MSLCFSVVLSYVGRGLCDGWSLVQRSLTKCLNKVTKPPVWGGQRSLQWPRATDDDGVGGVMQEPRTVRIRRHSFNTLYYIICYFLQFSSSSSKCWVLCQEITRHLNSAFIGIFHRWSRNWEKTVCCRFGCVMGSRPSKCGSWLHCSQVRRLMCVSKRPDARSLKVTVINCPHRP
jgi:hypothetical protein